MKRETIFFTQLLILNYSILILSSCSVQKQIAKSAKADVLDTKALQTAHVGISIFDPAANKYLYNYQGDKHFVPASNIKLPTCYAAMKYLGDSLVGFKWDIFQDTILKIFPSGDPTFLHSNFNSQRTINFLKSFKQIEIRPSMSGYNPELGNGWSWNDYLETYMAYPSIFPVYGNIATFQIKDDSLYILPGTLNNNFRRYKLSGKTFEAKRRFSSNEFWSFDGRNSFQQIPFYPDLFDVARMIEDTIGIKTKLEFLFGSFKRNIFHSQPTDSLLKPMMHRSDNFFAEQSLLMVSNEMLGVMNDEKIIDTLLETDFKDLPQKPRWVDGSGLSRYNLFTPQDFVAILNKMKNEFGIERIKVILPTGGEGTISSYYKADSGYIYGKTGTLSGVVAFSGFLYTKKGKLLIFSTLVNNHQATATEVRRAVEKFLQGIRNTY
jgi:D-alanyl-D-alanine carboxypeptidase/D-alanyl-D-alanine-endopeptidase (penicillin-binding protein 4)